MKEEVLENLQERLETIFCAYAKLLQSKKEDFFHQIETRILMNEKFLFSAHLSFMKDRVNGDELVISVGIFDNNGICEIDSDICSDNGRVLAVGPSVKNPSKEDLKEWGTQFECFLEESRSVIHSNIRKL